MYSAGNRLADRRQKLVETNPSRAAEMVALEAGISRDTRIGYALADGVADQHERHCDRLPHSGRSTDANRDSDINARRGRVKLKPNIDPVRSERFKGERCRADQLVVAADVELRERDKLGERSSRPANICDQPIALEWSLRIDQELERCSPAVGKDMLPNSEREPSCARTRCPGDRWHELVGVCELAT